MPFITYRVSVFLFLIWLKVLHRFKIYGRENIPGKGAYICAPNHVSYADPPVAGAAFLPRAMSFMAKKELFDSKHWGWWFRMTGCICILRNKNDFSATKKAIKHLNAGVPIALFPEGTRSTTKELLDAELGVAFLAEKTNTPVIPVYVHGTSKIFPVPGKYVPWTPVRLYIGKPVDFGGIMKMTDKREKYNKMAAKIMSEIAELKKRAIREVGEWD